MEEQKPRVQTDQALAEQVNAYRAANGYVNRNQICKAHHTTVERLMKLYKLGLIAKLPDPMSPSIAATARRKKHGTAKNWFINKPAPWMKA